MSVINLNENYVKPVFSYHMDKVKAGPTHRLAQSNIHPLRGGGNECFHDHTTEITTITVISYFYIQLLPVQSEKKTDHYQTAQSAQADTSRNFSLSLNFLHYIG